MKDVKKVRKVLQSEVFSLFYTDQDGRKCEVRRNGERYALLEDGEIVQTARDARVEIFKDDIVWMSGNGFRTKLCPVLSIARTKTS